jgi:fumarate reductase subunit D
MKRSHEPVFWALFGAGGMLSALLGPVLIFVTGIAVPLGWLPPDTMDHARMLAFLRSPLGALGAGALIALLLFHGCHRLLHSLHDLGLRRSRWTALAFYGFAALGSAVAFVLLASLPR